MFSWLAELCWNYLHIINSYNYTQTLFKQMPILSLGKVFQTERTMMKLNRNRHYIKKKCFRQGKLCINYFSIKTQTLPLKELSVSVASTGPFKDGPSTIVRRSLPLTSWSSVSSSTSESTFFGVDITKRYSVTAGCSSGTVWLTGTVLFSTVTSL